MRWLSRGSLFLATAFAASATLWTTTANALDASPWERVLSKHAKQGGFDYAALKADANSMADLGRFLTAVGEMPQAEPLSSWLNAYNALVVKAVADRHPIRSVRDVPGFFDRVRHRVAGQMRTLDDVENRIIRPRFQDARIHVALNCGAVSCPALHPHVFREASLDQTLTRLARAMVRSNRHVRVQDGKLEISELFFWFAADFERDGGSVWGWLQRYDATQKLEGLSAATERGRIPYRWALNQRDGS